MSGFLQKQHGVLILIFALFCVLPVRAQKKVSFEGYGETGFKTHERSIINGNAQEAYYLGKLQVRIDVKDGIDAQLDFRSNSTDNRVELKEFNVKFKVHKLLNIKVGQFKLPFGYEQFLNREKRTSVEKTEVQQHLSENGFGGRSFGIMFYKKYSVKKSTIPYSYFVHFYKNNAFLSGVVLRGVFHTPQFVVGINLQANHRGGREELEHNGLAFGADLSYKKEDFKIQLSGTMFDNTNLNVLNRQLNHAFIKDNTGDPLLATDIQSASARAELTYDIKYKDAWLKKLVPFFIVGSIYNDISDMEHQLHQFMAGANIYITKKVRIRLQGDLRRHRLKEDNPWSSRGNNATVGLQIKF